jgi:molybdenum cofactor biosynthesis enzyme MoaA
MGSRFSIATSSSSWASWISLKVQTSFTTNATRITDKVVECLASLEHLLAVNVSLDSPEPEQYNSRRRAQARPLRVETSSAEAAGAGDGFGFLHRDA